MSGRLEGDVAVITGSSRGLGKSLALGFATEGADIVVNYISSRDEAEATAREIEALGQRAIVVQADVSKRAEIKRLFSEANERLGKIDILVNNAGINKRCWFEETSDEDWDQIMEVNLKGPFICCQEVFPYMKENGGGRIINMSSVASQYYGPKTVHYAVSKGGLNTLTKVIARYGAPHNILVNAVAPGQILTDQTREEFESGAVGPLLDMTLLKRGGTEEDVVSASLLLAEKQQTYMTGQVLSIAGGAYLG